MYVCDAQDAPGHGECCLLLRVSPPGVLIRSMFDGAVYERTRKPSPQLKLPPVCWAVYERLDGTTSVGAVAEALGVELEAVETAVRRLQQQNLVAEPVVSYAEYQEWKSEGRSAAEAGNGAQEPAGASAETANGETANRQASASGTEQEDGTEPRRLHLPTLWEWIGETTGNVKSYKNTQAFVLMESSDALESVGVSDLNDLKELEWCRTPEVVDALERAVENNVGASIPDRCYR